VGEQMARAWEDIKSQANKTIQEGERDKMNPWIKRTQWLPYLLGMERSDLLSQGAKSTVIRVNFFVSARSYACTRVYCRMGVGSIKTSQVRSI
jgi:hypothetical protein